MIDSLEIYISRDKSIDYHLALEEYLLTQVRDSTGILFIWTNEPTVVIGRNQNPFRECNLSLMEADGVTLGRRKSGGGAVYQDKGNLNISFLCKSVDYDKDRQNRLWTDAMAALGIKAKVDGRNDIILENGRKCSGMAYHQSGDLQLQHGTILVDVDLERLERYLNVPKDKLITKGIASVRSRVGNLIDYCAGLTVDVVIENILAVLPGIYENASVKLKAAVPEEEVADRYERYASEDWKYGRKMEFTYKRAGRMPFGQVEVELVVDKGIIKEAQIYSDALDAKMIDEMETWLCGRSLVQKSKEDISNNLAKLWEFIVN